MYPSPSISSAPNRVDHPAPERPSRATGATTTGDRAATAAHVAIAMPGALTAGDLFCDACAADLDADGARGTRRTVSRTAAQIDAALAADRTSRGLRRAGRATAPRLPRSTRHRGGRGGPVGGAARTRWTSRRGGRWP